VVAKMTRPMDDLIRSLERQNLHPQIIKDIREKYAQKEFRQVFLILENLKKSGQWVLDESDEKRLEEFWWSYAN
jgi:hypothetical protein